MTRLRNGHHFTWFTTLSSRERARAVVRELQQGGNHAFYEEDGTMFKVFTRIRKARP